MKKALAMAVFAVAALPVMAQQVKYSIQGECPADAQMVYVADRVSGTPIDSVATSNGKFAIEGNYQKDALLFVKSNVSKWLVVFFNDGAPVNIDLKTNTLKGSAQNESLNYYDRQNDSLTMKMSGLQNQLLAIYNDQSLSQEQKEEKLKAKVSELQPEANKLVASTNELMDKMLKENPNTLVPAAFISDLYSLYGLEKMKQLFASNPPFASHPAVAEVKNYIAQEEARMKIIGKRFTDLEESDTEGNVHKLSEYVGKGQWVLIDFWASWCGPCRAEMPNVVENYEKYHARGFNIVGLSFDQDKDAWLKAIDDLKMPWVHLSDLKGWKTVAASVYGINAIPASLLVDPDGIIVARDLRGDALGAKLQEIFGE